MEPGRNDPCPCGSGKKYKKCCLLRQETVILTHHLLRGASDEAAKLLLSYGKKVYGEEGIYEAWYDFWAGEPKEEAFTHSPYLQLFIPWFIYQWYPEELDRGSEYLFPSRHTLVAQFLKKQGWTADAFTRRFLENAWQEPLSFWQVEAVEPGKGMLLKDLAIEREFFVHEVSGSKIIKKWDIVLGQVVGLDGEYILSASGPYTLPASIFRETVIEFLRPKKAYFLSPASLLEYDVDFLWYYHECVEVLLNPPMPQLTNTDGEELVFTNSRYAFDPAHRQEIIGKLQAMENIEYHGEEGGEAEFGWIVRNESAMMDNTVKGHIKAGEGYLLTECNSKLRDQQLKDRLLQSLGALIAHEDTDYKPIDLNALPKPSEDSGPLDLNKLPQEARAQLVGIMEQQHMRWVDMQIPALQNKTPREAVRTKDGREQVIGLINDWENSQFRMQDPQFQFDFNKLRKELGLEVE